MYVAHIPASLPLLSPPIHVALWRVSCEQVAEEDNTGACFTDSSALCSGTTWKLMALHYSLTWVGGGRGLREVMRKNLPNGQTFSSIPGCSFCLEATKTRVTDLQ